MSREGNYTNKKFLTEAELRKLEGKGIKVDSLRQSIKDKSSAMSGNKVIEK